GFSLAELEVVNKVYVGHGVSVFFVWRNVRVISHVKTNFHLHRGIDAGAQRRFRDGTGVVIARFYAQGLLEFRRRTDLPGKTCGTTQDHTGLSLDSLILENPFPTKITRTDFRIQLHTFSVKQTRAITNSGCAVAVV